MTVDEFIKIEKIELDKKKIVFTKKTRLWCRLPYPNHPNGCPNYNKNPLCPPNVEFMDNILDEYSHFRLIFARFDLKKHRERMLSVHPNWTDKQANCLLYWQNSVKKKLKSHIQEIITKNNDNKIYVLACGSGFRFTNFDQEKIYSMEAVGINVFKTLQNIGISYELKPSNEVIMTTLLCSQSALSF